MEAERLSGADEVLNELLVKLFKDIVEIEEKCLITREFKDISVNDMHVIEAIGIKEPKSGKALKRDNRHPHQGHGRFGGKALCLKGAGKEG